jgi:hypothetical protein
MSAEKIKKLKDVRDVGRMMRDINIYPDSSGSDPCNFHAGK